MATRDYAALYRLQDSYWWCDGMRSITVSLVDDVLSSPTTLRILDAGCGSGAVARVLQSDHQVVGLEYSAPALRVARADGLRTPIQGTIERLPFADSCFDLVLCLDVLYHVGIDDDQAAWMELWRVLRAGGTLLVRCPAYAWLQGPHDRALGTNRRLTARELRAAIEAAGFEARRLTYANTLLFPVQAAWRLLHRGRRETKPDLFTLPGWLERALARVLHLECRLLRHVDLPFGLSVFCIARKGEKRTPHDAMD